MRAPASTRRPTKRDSHAQGRPRLLPGPLRGRPPPGPWHDPPDPHLRPPAPAGDRRLPRFRRARRACGRRPAPALPSHHRSGHRRRTDRLGARAFRGPRRAGRGVGRDRAGAALVLIAHRRGPDLRPPHAGLRPRSAHADRVLQPGADRCTRHPPQQRRAGRAAGVHVDAVERRRQPRRRGRHAHRDGGAVLAGHAARARPAAAVRAARRAGSAGAWPTSPASATASTARWAR